jgi:Arc/MetJ family transcription regulator
MMMMTTTTMREYKLHSHRLFVHMELEREWLAVPVGTAELIAGVVGN